jgi:hypothetical protein
MQSPLHQQEGGGLMRRLVSALSAAAVFIAVIAVPASAASPRVAGAIQASHQGHVTAVAKITGSGQAIMTDNGGTTLWWENDGGITLYSDGSAKGRFFCVDLSPPALRGIVWGAVTSWNLDGGFINLYVPSSMVSTWPIGTPEVFPVPWRIQIQRFGGAEVGRWTLDVPDGKGGWVSFCLEKVTGGAIVFRQLDWKGEGPAGTD